MSFRSSSRISTKRDHPPDALDSTTRKENFNKLRNIFEIKRPSKSPTSTLRKSRSVSSLNILSSDEEKEVNKDKSYMRTNSSCINSTLSSKYKRKSAGHTSKRKSSKQKDVFANVENSDEFVVELKKQLLKQNNRKDYDVPSQENHTEPLHKTENTCDQEQDDTQYKTDEDFQISQSERKYIKNNSYAIGSPQNSLGRRNKSTKELLSRKQKKETRQPIKSFTEADSEGETENYRKSLVAEMDFEVAKMKSDGFIDDDENNNNYTNDNINENNGSHRFQSTSNENKDHEDVISYLSKRNSSKSNKYKQLFEGIFNEFDKNIQMIQDDCKSKMVSRISEMKSKCHDENEENFNCNINRNDLEAIQVCECRTEENVYINQSSSNECQTNGFDSETFTTLDYHENSDISNDNVYENTEICQELVNKFHENIYDEVYVDENEVINNNSTNDTRKSLHKSGDNIYDEIEKQTEETVILNQDHVNPSNVEDDFFGGLEDDLENGSYFVEAYNIAGKELVIVEISIERRTVNLDKPFSMESIKKSMNSADLVFHKKEDKSLNIIEDPKEFVNENAHLLSNGFYNDPESNRSTVYSTTSRDSDVFDTDDEGISMGNTERKTSPEDNAYNNVRRETFCDDKGIVRIERVGYPETVHFREDDNELQTPVSRNNSLAQKGKLSYIIDEIKSTEKKYVADLTKVVKRYMPYIERHASANLYGRQHIMFGNIEILWVHQKDFLAALEDCGEEVEDIVKTFIDFKELFKLYPKYFKNKPRADVVLREFSSIIRKAQDKYHERLDLSSYLLTPLQRLGKYKLFLENIEKQLRKLELPTETTVTALEMIKTEMSKGNDFVAIESIDSSPIPKTEYGSFKMREIFTIVRPRRFESMVFLFENVIVFTTIGSQRHSEIYNYSDSIKMNDLRIATFEDSTIHLTDFTKFKKVSRADRFTYVLEAKTEKIKDSWRKAIEDVLWQQLYKVKENTLRMYQTNPYRRNKVSRSRTKSTGKR